MSAAVARSLQAVCLRHAARISPTAKVALLEHQGGCSVTILVLLQDAADDHGSDHNGWNHILQYRPERYRVDIGLASAANRVYGPLAPKTIDRGWIFYQGMPFQVLELSVLSGTRFSEVQPQSMSLADDDLLGVRCLLRTIAESFSRSWHAASQSSRMTGRIGSSIVPRLRRLSQQLPDARLRRLASQIAVKVESGELKALPVVLTHGDLLPSNILVDENSWTLEGLVDWAEAEYLPFGCALYAVEHLVGFSIGQAFLYYVQAQLLCNIFWAELRRQIPELNDPQILQAVMLARDVGILLWHGYAWDEGRLDRVVSVEKDGTEVGYLRAFLDSSIDRRRDSKL